MLRARHRPITVSARAARLVRALSSTIVGNIDCDQTRLLLIVERGVERLYRGPHGIERRHESSQSLLERILANSSARQPPGCSHESTGPLSERNRRLGWGASRRRKRSIRPLGFDRPPHSDLSIDNNSPVGAPRRLKKRTKLPPAWIGRARNVARFETWLAQQSSHNELTITWRVLPRLGGTLPKVGRHAQLIPADSGGRSDRPLTSAVRLIDGDFR